jgi:hypothetical protein
MTNALLLHFTGIGTGESPCVFREVFRTSCISIALRRRFIGSTDESYLC